MDGSLSLKDYAPRSKLVVPSHLVARAKYPAIDAHNHLALLGEQADDPNWRLTDADELIHWLEEHNVSGIVDLDGYPGDRLGRVIDGYQSRYPNKVAVLARLEWNRVAEPGWPEALATQFRQALRRGADGLKISKALGLSIKDEHGRTVTLDDPRLAPLWYTAAEAGVPVLIHTADPVAFFDPIDRFNERWDELQQRPEWSWHGPEMPSFQELIDRLVGLVSEHTQTIFQLAHVGCYAENLGFVAEKVLKPHPNVYTDISERIAELGRQPYTARSFLIEFQDRVLFGTDRPPLGPWYPYYFRFLETFDEYFPHGPEEPPRQGRWQIYGVGLPDEVLQKIYRENAQRLYLRLSART